MVGRKGACVVGISLIQTTTYKIVGEETEIKMQRSAQEVVQAQGVTCSYCNARVGCAAVRGSPNRTLPFKQGFGSRETEAIACAQTEDGVDQSH